MALVVNVHGGTDAGKRRPPGEPRPPWTCKCGRDNPGYAIRCLSPGCRELRR